MNQNNVSELRKFWESVASFPPQDGQMGFPDQMHFPPPTQNQPFHPFQTYPHSNIMPQRRQYYEEPQRAGHVRFSSAPLPQTSFYGMDTSQPHMMSQLSPSHPIPSPQASHTEDMTMRGGELPMDLETSLTNLLLGEAGDLKMGADGIIADLHNQFSQISAHIREQQSPLRIRKDHKFAKALGGTDVRNTDTLPTYTVEVDVARLLNVYKFFVQLLEGSLRSGGNQAGANLKTQTHMTFEENLNLIIDLDAFYAKYSNTQAQLPPLENINTDYLLNHTTMRCLLRRQNRVITKKRRKLTSSTAATIPQKTTKQEVLRDGLKNAQARLTPCEDNVNILLASFPNLVVTKSATAQKKVSLRFELCVDGWAFFYVDSGNSFQTISVHGCKHQAPKKVNRIHPNYAGVWGNRIAIIHGINFKNVPAWKKGELEVAFGDQLAEVLKIDGTMIEILVPPNEPGSYTVTLTGVKKSNTEVRRDEAEGMLTFDYYEEQDYVARILREIHQEKTVPEQPIQLPLSPTGSTPGSSGASPASPVRMGKQFMDHRRVKSEGQGIIPGAFM